MSLSINSVTIGGNLTRDPELKTVSNGKPVCTFGVAINDKYKAGDGTMKETVCFVDVEVWNGTAEIAHKYLRKGSPVVLEGKLKSDSWQTQAGEKRQKLLLKGERLHLVGSKPEQALPPVAKPVSTAVAGDDEPPF